MSLTRIQKTFLARLADSPDEWATLSYLITALPSYPRSRSLVLNTLQGRSLIETRWDRDERCAYYRLTDSGREAVGQTSLAKGATA